MFAGSFLVRGKLWTPANITTELWLDAVDLSTITTSGLKVSEWRDKSGNGRNLTQSNDSLRPTLTNGNIIFGASSLVIPNSDVSDYALKFPTTSFEIFAIIEPTNLYGLQVFFGARAFSSGWFAGLNDNTAYMRLYSASELWVPSPMASGTMQTGLQIWNASAPRNGTGEYRRNEELIQQTTETISSSSLANSAFCRVGSYENDGMDAYGYFEGKVNEVIILSYVSAESTRQKIAGYLAHKWGLAGSLPSNHPYKNDPPKGT